MRNLKSGIFSEHDSEACGIDINSIRRDMWLFFFQLYYESQLVI